jgi:hypothetical protein
MEYWVALLRTTHKKPEEVSNGGSNAGYFRSRTVFAYSEDLLVNSEIFYFPQPRADWGAIVAFSLFENYSDRQAVYSGSLDPFIVKKDDIIVFYPNTIKILVKQITLWDYLQLEDM